MMGLFRASSIPYPLLLLHPFFFIACGMWINLSTMWSSCFFRRRTFHSLPCGFVGFHCTTINGFWNLVRCSHLRSQFPVASVSLLFARHGCVHWPSQFSSRFENFFVCMVIRIDEVDSSQSSSIVELWLLVFPFLFFSILSGFPSFGPYFRPYMIWSRSRLNSCQSPWTTYNLWEVSLSREWILWIRQTSVRIDIPVVINTFLLHDVQISTSRPCYANVFQWNSECFFLCHMELNSRFIVMTIDEVTLDRTEVGTGFIVIFWFCRLRLSRFALKCSTEIFAPCGLFPP